VKTRKAKGECALISTCTVYLVTVGFFFLMAAAVLSGQPSDLLARADDRVRGDPQAPVTLIEYSDFTCGFCLKFFRETWPRLRADYIETGKVRFLYRDFPRGFQGPGLDAAVAARCAGNQGRYWQMHDRLFGDDRRLGPADLQRHAQTIGLDLPLFSKCLEEAPHAGTGRKVSGWDLSAPPALSCSGRRARASSDRSRSRERFPSRCSRNRSIVCSVRRVRKGRVEFPAGRAYP